MIPESDVMIGSAGIFESAGGGVGMGQVMGEGIASLAPIEGPRFVPMAEPDEPPKPNIETTFPKTAMMATGQQNNMNYIMLGGIALVIVLLLRK